MTTLAKAAMDVDAALSAPSVQVQNVRYRFDEPPESIVCMEDKIRAERCRNGRHPGAGT